MRKPGFITVGTAILLAVAALLIPDTRSLSIGTYAEKARFNATGIRLYVTDRYKDVNPDLATNHIQVIKDTHGKTSNLSAADIDALIAYMKSLDRPAK
jgi:hypothetical protein